MFLNEDNISLNESSIHFPLKTNDKEKEKIDLEKLTDDIRNFKDEIDKTEAGQFYNKNKAFLDVIADLLKNWAMYGLIMGFAVVPFSLSISLFKFLIRKSLQYIQDEADKRLVVESLKNDIDRLKIIKNSNKDNEVIIEKIEESIDFANDILHQLLED